MNPKNKNPDGSLKNTEIKWSQRQVFEGMDERLSLLNGVAPFPAAASETFRSTDLKTPYSGPNELPTADDLRKIKKVKFEIAGDWPDLRAAVNADIARLQTKFPDYTFSVTFGVSP